MGKTKEIVCHMTMKGFLTFVSVLNRSSGKVHISEPCSSAWTQQQTVLRCHGAVCFPPPARTKWEVELYLEKERVEAQSRCPRGPHTWQVSEEQSTRTFRDSLRTFSSPAVWEEARAKPGNTACLPPASESRWASPAVSQQRAVGTHTDTLWTKHTRN